MIADTNSLDSQSGSTLLDYFKALPGVIATFRDTPSAKITPAPAAAPAFNWKPFAIIGAVGLLLGIVVWAFKD
jgi:hypothetical protein